MLQALLLEGLPLACRPRVFETLLDCAQPAVSYQYPRLMAVKSFTLHTSSLTGERIPLCCSSACLQHMEEGDPDLSNYLLHIMTSLPKPPCLTYDPSPLCSTSPFPLPC